MEGALEAQWTRFPGVAPEHRTSEGPLGGSVEGRERELKTLIHESKCRGRAELSGEISSFWIQRSRLGVRDPRFSEVAQACVTRASAKSPRRAWPALQRSRPGVRGPRFSEVAQACVARA